MDFQWPRVALSSDEGRRALRQAILEQIFSAGNGHPGGSFSLVEILAAIFDEHFVHTLENPGRADRDRFVLSKGHGVPALYSVLSFLGYFPAQELVKLRKLGHYLQGHPDRDKFKLMEASTGSLGQGASVALGLALALRWNFVNGKIPRLPTVYCVLGDGEMQEGQVWECLMATGKFKPGNLVFILDRNGGQIDGPVSEVMALDPLEDKLRAFNLNVKTVDGHDITKLNSLFSALEIKPEARANFIVAETVKGKGVSFMEDPTKWHGVSPNREQLEKALQELFPAANASSGGASDAAASPFGRLAGG